MRTQVVNYFPGDRHSPRQVRERYWLENGMLVGVYESFYRNGRPNIIKEFNSCGERISLLRFRPDGTRITKLDDQAPTEQEITLTAEELESAMKTYQEARKKAINILLSKKINVSTRATDKSLLKQFKEFEENRFSF